LVAYHRGKREEAQRLCEAALALRRTLGDTHGIAKSLTAVGFLAHGQGDDKRATDLLEETLTLSRQLGDHVRTVHGLGDLAWVLHCRGDHARATALYAEALTLASAIGDRRDVTWLLEDLAMVGATYRLPEQAARLFGAAAALRETSGSPNAQFATADYSRRLQFVREALGEAGFATAWAEGRAMTLEQAVDAALTGAAETAGGTAADRAAPDAG
jgi:tetratricopeptide (TPR) repeat protein